RAPHLLHLRARLPRPTGRRGQRAAGRRRCAVIAIVAPEPARWIARLAALASAVDEVEVIAPWALPGAAPLRAAAGRVPFVRRRLAPAAPPARIAALPGFALGELALAAWIGRRTDRRLRAMF